MSFYFHYQEAAVTRNVFDDVNCRNIVTDVLISQEEFCRHYFDEFIVEHLLNSIGTFTDNGYMEYNGRETPLEFRIAYVVSEGNLEDYANRHNLEIPLEQHPMGLA